MTKTRSALLTMLALALLKRPLEQALHALLPDAAVNAVPHCIAALALTAVLFGGGALLLHPWDRTRLPRQKKAWPGVLLGAAGALLCRGAMEVVNAAWQSWLGLTPAALTLPETLPVTVLYVLALAMLPALLEEVFFRGALLSALTAKASRTGAILLTTGLFALMHGAENLPGTLAASLLLTLLMARTGYVAAPVAAHLVYNLTALSWPTIPAWGAALCGIGLCGLYAYLIARQPKFARQYLPRTEGLIAAAAVAVLIAGLLV